MAYCTVQQVRDNHERLPDTGYDSNISAFIADADGIIDAKIRGKVDLPFTSTPAIIAYISKSLATFFALRWIFGAQVEEYHDFVQDYWDKAMELLDQIVDCEINFGVSEASQDDMIKSNTQGKEPIFDLQDPISQDYHDDGADDRYGE